MIRLTENYRSSPQILAVANAVLAGGALDGTASAAEASASALRANRPDGPAAPHPRPSPTTPPRPGPSPAPSATTTGPTGRWSAQAVLCRTNAQTAVIERALHQAGIPFRVRGGGGLLDQPEVKAALRDLQRHTGDFATAVADLQATADRWPLRRPRRRRADRSTGRRRPASADDDADGQSDDRAANLGALVRMAHDYAALDSRPTGAGFVAWLTDATRADQPDGSGDGVEIATFHAAKGLEWPVVHLAGLEQGLVPIGHARDDDALAEERRLFYVAVTRAESRAAVHLGRGAHVRHPHGVAHPLALPGRGRGGHRRRSQAGDVPADWVQPPPAQRGRLADVSRRRRPTAPPLASRRRPGSARAAHGRSRPPAVASSTTTTWPCSTRSRPGA